MYFLFGEIILLWYWYFLFYMSGNGIELVILWNFLDFIIVICVCKFEKCNEIFGNL